MATQRLTMAQALIKYLSQQYVTRDGNENPFFAGVWGIFGHGNVAGIGQALQQYHREIRYYQSRNEQAQVHASIAYAKMKNRLQTFACTTSVGPGATNMVTGAATATINRLPVLLLPGDIFAERIQNPVLQQLEFEHSPDISANDCFRPVSRFWDRIYRAEQLIASLPEAMRVLTSPADTGAVTLALPQDTQAQAFDYPAEMFEKRVWSIPRNRPDRHAVQQAIAWIRESVAPLIVAGGGVLYSDATALLQQFVEQSGIPVGETQAGKGSLPYNHPLNLGAIGTTGTPGANIIAREADLIIGIGTRYSDFTSASNTAFQNPNVRFINLNVAEWDAYKRNALPLVGDAYATLQELLEGLNGYRTADDYQARCHHFNRQWDAEVERIYTLGHTPLISQGEVIGAVNQLSAPQDVVLCAAGSLPGDLHKLWRTRDPKGYHLEYGNSCMGYEIAGGMGVKMATPERDVYVMVGDGSYLMMSSELVTMVQERIKVIVVLINNHGFASIGGLSASVGSAGFGTRYRHRDENDQLEGEVVQVDFATNMESFGAKVIRTHNKAELEDALRVAKAHEGGPICIYIEADREQRVGGYESWWDVAIAEVSDNPEVQSAYAAYREKKQKERYFL